MVHSQIDTPEGSANEAAPFDADASTVRSGLGALRAFIDDHRIVVDDGSGPSRIMAVVLIGAFSLAAVDLLVSNLRFGPQDPYLPDGTGDSRVGAIMIVASLVLIGLFLAVGAFNSVGTGRADDKPLAPRTRLLPAVIALVNAFIGFSLLTTAATVRIRAGIFRELPSLISLRVSDGDVCLAVGIIVLLSCVLFLAVPVVALPHRRLAAALLASLPSLLCSSIFVLSRRTGLVLSEWARQQLTGLSGPSVVRFVSASTAAHVAMSPLLVLVLASAMAVAVLVTFGTVEFVDAKANLGRLVPARWASRTWVVISLIGLVGVTFALSRLGWLPDGRKAVGAFAKTQPESWTLAALLAAGGLATIRSATRRPLDRRNARVVIAVACVSLVAGHVALFVSSLIGDFARPMLEQDSALGRFVFERLPQWSAWFQDWSTIIVAVGMGLWSLWRISRRERSDRVVFAAAFAVVVFPLQLATLLSIHNADHGIWSFSPALPEQIGLVAAGIIGIGLLARRPVLNNASASLVVLLIVLVMLLDAVVPDTFTVGTFQMLLVAPFLYRFLFHSEDLRGDPRRGAIAVASIGLLFVAEAVAVAAGLLSSGIFEGAELIAFYQLTAPLALMVLCTLATSTSAALSTQVETVERESVALQDLPGQHGRSWPARLLVATSPVVGLLIVAGLAFALVKLPAKPDRGVYRVNVGVVPDGFVALQTLHDQNSEEAVVLNSSDSTTATSIVRMYAGRASVASPDAQSCDPTALSSLIGETTADQFTAAPPLAGMKAITTSIATASATYIITCAYQQVGGADNRILVYETGVARLSDDVQSIIANLSFATTLPPSSS
jgi:hypothetical protein